MSELLALKDTPVPTLLIIVGGLFVFFALGGRLNTDLQISAQRQWVSGVFGILFVAAGIWLYLGLPSAPTSATTAETPTLAPSVSAQATKPLQPSGALIGAATTAQPPVAPNVPVAQPVVKPAGTERIAATPIPQAAATPTAAEVPAAQPTATPCDRSLLKSGFGRIWTQRLAVQQRLGCPLQAEQGGDIAEQPFERGSMFWFGPADTIYVFAAGGRWSAFQPNKQRGSDSPPDEQSPDDLLRPVSGFGLVWDTHGKVREGVGWATKREQGPFNGAYQRFERGVMLYSPTGLGQGGVIYVLYDDLRFEQYDDAPSAS